MMALKTWSLTAVITLSLHWPRSQISAWKMANSALFWTFSVIVPFFDCFREFWAKRFNSVNAAVFPRSRKLPMSAEFGPWWRMVPHKAKLGIHCEIQDQHGRISLSVCLSVCFLSLCLALAMHYSLSNVILADEKMTSFHRYLRYSHKSVIIVFSIPGAILWA